ncbi:hypothetical protein M413DRAFT_11188 [Hebeloma cylindrosporum]|uniref:Uncharacterized protein n=1 Tax=Hebeloma cylindrosporum TaxID=76867 RepID=A0A0C3CBA0_HEBCY|nr:hypothetical protein M413DRAFT_11188 [Hebeloma cylindrosporum h7]
MSLRHNVLIEKFELQQETRDLATKLVRLASQKTAPGSGRELKEWKTGLPAVCALLASERLNSGDVNSKSAQAASCLKPKDFQRVYALVKMAIEEAESSAVVTYEQLHVKYRSKPISKIVDPYIMEAENELQPLAIGYEMESTMFRGVCYFWVFSIFAPTVMPSTEKFAFQEELPLKKFTTLLSLLNEHAPDLRMKIALKFKRKRAAAKEAAEVEAAGPSVSSTATSTPQRSPRKATLRRELPNNDSPKKPVEATASTDREPEQRSPLRRSSRTISPTKNAVVRRPWVKTPIRELPSKDSPKKRPAESTNDNDITQDEPTPPSTPTKKRRIASPEKLPKPSSSSSAHPSLEASTEAFHRALASPTKQTVAYSTSGPLPSSPLKRTLFSAGDKSAFPAYPESSDESEPELPLPRRRFRPVYGDSQQWEARDPRLAKIWKKAEMGHTSNPQRASSKRK